MSTSGITCITCRVAFNNADLQRFHYKSDWHRYNLKRKVVGMPPVTAEDFKHKVLAQQAQNAEAKQDTSTFCKTCGKHFNTWNAYSNHLQSKKHKDTEVRIKQKKDSEVVRENIKNREKEVVEDEQVDEDKEKEDAEAQCPRKNQVAAMEEGDEKEWEEEEPIPVTSCLFCSDASESLEDNVDHMTGEHSFFIPNIDYLIDPMALFEYLGEKVGSGLMCLWCNEKGRTFFTVDAVQRHMRDKGHCKLNYEAETALEYADFYDFRSSYPDYEEGEEDDDNDGSGSDNDGSGSDDEVEVDIVEQEGYELVLPSGARIGHRELMKYYKQNLPPKREIALRNARVTKKLKNYYKAIGQASGEVYVRQAKDMKVIQKFREKQRLKVQKGLQKHFRPQVMF